jgi:allophanate hydrolase subunit 1
MHLSYSFFVGSFTNKEIEMNEEISHSTKAMMLSSVVAIVLSGCAEKRGCKISATTSTNKSVQKERQTDIDRQIAALDTAIKTAQPTTVVKEVSGESSLFPPNANSGECYARVLTPAKYKIITEKVVKEDASDRLQVIPAKYSWSKKKVLIKEATQKIVPVPAKYKTIKEKVLISPESERLVNVPAVFETVTKKVLISEAHLTWKRGRGPIEKMCETTGEILCLVQVPAKYKTFKQRVLKTPAMTKRVVIPAVYKTITKKVLVAPATTKVIEIPAVYKTIKVKDIIEPATIKTTTIPQKYTTIQKRVLVSDAELKWQRVMCKSSMNRENIKNIQKALKEAGFNPGPIDGIMGWRTKSALSKFQKANSLSAGELTQKTLEALGV